MGYTPLGLWSLLGRDESPPDSLHTLYFPLEPATPQCWSGLAPGSLRVDAGDLPATKALFDV